MAIPAHRRCRRCQVKWSQRDGLCFACGTSLADGREAPRGRQGIQILNRATVLQQPARSEAQSSWWLGVDRDRFTARATAQQPRMARSAMAQAVSGVGGLAWTRH